MKINFITYSPTFAGRNKRLADMTIMPDAILPTKSETPNIIDEYALPISSTRAQAQTTQQRRAFELLRGMENANLESHIGRHFRAERSDDSQIAKNNTWHAFINTCGYFEALQTSPNLARLLREYNPSKTPGIDLVQGLYAYATDKRLEDYNNVREVRDEIAAHANWRSWDSTALKRDIKKLLPNIENLPPQPQGMPNSTYRYLCLLRKSPVNEKITEMACIRDDDRKTANKFHATCKSELLNNIANTPKMYFILAHEEGLLKNFSPNSSPEEIIAEIERLNECNKVIAGRLENNNVKVKNSQPEQIAQKTELKPVIASQVIIPQQSLQTVSQQVSQLTESPQNEKNIAITNIVDSANITETYFAQNNPGSVMILEQLYENSNLTDEEKAVLLLQLDSGADERSNTYAEISEFLNLPEKSVKTASQSAIAKMASQNAVLAQKLAKYIGEANQPKNVVNAHSTPATAISKTYFAQKNPEDVTKLEAIYNGQDLTDREKAVLVLQLGKNGDSKHKTQIEMAKIFDVNPITISRANKKVLEVIESKSPELAEKISQYTGTTERKRRASVRKIKHNPTNLVRIIHTPSTPSAATPSGAPSVLSVLRTQSVEDVVAVEKAPSPAISKEVQKATSDKKVEAFLDKHFDYATLMGQGRLCKKTDPDSVRFYIKKNMWNTYRNLAGYQLARNAHKDLPKLLTKFSPNYLDVNERVEVLQAFSKGELPAPNSLEMTAHNEIRIIIEKNNLSTEGLKPAIAEVFENEEKIQLVNPNSRNALFEYVIALSEIKEMAGTVDCSLQDKKINPDNYYDLCRTALKAVYRL